MKNIITISFAIASLMLLGSSAALCGELNVSSPAFKNGSRIPVNYTCTGADLSPAIQWDFKGTAKSFAVTCTDPDAPGGTFVHWVIFNIAPETRTLREGFPRAADYAGILQGVTDFGSVGYNGPCPPAGRPHRYIFTVYALDILIDDKGVSYSGLIGRIKGHIVAQGRITGTYGR